MVTQPRQKVFLGLGECPGNLLVDRGAEGTQRGVHFRLAGDGTRPAAGTPPQINDKGPTRRFALGRSCLADGRKACRRAQRQRTRPLDHLTS